MHIQKKLMMGPFADFLTKNWSDFSINIIEDTIKINDALLISLKIFD